MQTTWYVHRKSYSLHKKTTWLSKWIWQSSGIQSQYSEIYGIFVHPQSEGETSKKNPIYYNNKKNKVPGSKFNQGAKKPMFGTLKKEIEGDTNK